MASRRDLFQSYQFMVQRVISGIVQRETDPIQTPLRKMIGSAFAGVMIAVVGLAGAGLIGVFFGTDTNEWQNSGVVIVETETGATFVWLPDRAAGENLLFPTVNFASAALLVNSVEVAEVSRASLLSAPRGPRLGIADAPDSLPDPERMLGDPWTLCSLPAETRDGRLTPNTALVVGRDISQGQLIGDSAVLVRDIEIRFETPEQTSLYLVTEGHRYPIPYEEPVLEGLTLQDTTQVEVGTAWLDALPSGLDLVPNPVAERGAASTAFPGAISGEVRYVESANDRQYYEVTPTQIKEITEVQSLILLADPAIEDTVYAGRVPEPLEIPSAVAAGLTDDRRQPLPERAPTDPPADQPTMFDTTDQNPTICGSFAAGEQTPQISIEAAVAGAEDAIATQR
ncbi:MAG: type VII secretion protein EccB, partial [Actinomycetota bacterium]|nr:type VII secretion protein EccB [Actinomycetota bacterium]